ncbi:MAG: hypothetical protein ACOYXB_04815 [Bacteroidota bacterium]
MAGPSIPMAIGTGTAQEITRNLRPPKHSPTAEAFGEGLSEGGPLQFTDSWPFDWLRDHSGISLITRPPRLASRVTRDPSRVS